MPIQSKALPRSSYLRRAIRSFTASSESGAETAHPCWSSPHCVRFTLFAIVEIDLHSAQLQAIGCSAMARESIRSSWVRSRRRAGIRNSRSRR